MALGIILRNQEGEKAELKVRKKTKRKRAKTHKGRWEAE